MKYIFPVLLILLTCCSAQITRPAITGNTFTGKNNPAIESIRSINENAPETLTAALSLWMRTDNRKIMTKGTLYYEKKNDRWKVTLRDPYIGTIVYHVLIEKGFITAYSTTDKVAIKTRVDSSTIFSDRYDPAAIFLISTGKIPLIAPLEKFSGNTDGEELQISAEQDGLSQKVTLKNNIPSVIEVTNARGNRFNIKYSGITGGGMRPPRKIHASEELSGDYFDIEYYSITTDVKISESVFSLNIPRGAKIIER